MIEVTVEIVIVYHNGYIEKFQAEDEPTVSEGLLHWCSNGEHWRVVMASVRRFSVKAVSASPAHEPLTKN